MNINIIYKTVFNLLGLFANLSITCSMRRIVLVDSYTVIRDGTRKGKTGTILAEILKTNIKENYFYELSENT